MAAPLDLLVRHLEEVRGRRLVVVTGAGISVASGVPTFRGTDEGAVWKNDVMEKATLAFFVRDPVASWGWYLDRFASLEQAEPNAAHHALVALERWQGDGGGSFLLVTQNIDALHHRAGSRALAEVHGSCAVARCAAYGCRHGAPSGLVERPDDAVAALREELRLETLPRCPQCGTLLRPHVLWFDEFYDEHEAYRWGDVQEAASSADLLLFVGTSFSVGVTDLFLREGLRRGVPVLSIDPGAHRPVDARIVSLAARSEELLPAAVASLSSA